MTTIAGKVDVADKASETWASAHPSDKVGEVKAGEVTAVPHRGSETKNTGEDSNAAAETERQGNNVISEMNNDQNSSVAQSVPKVDERQGNNVISEMNNDQNSSVAQSVPKENERKELNGMAKEQEKLQEKVQDRKDGHKEAAENGENDEAKPGDKRKIDEAAEGEKPDEKASDESDVKKQKTANGAANGTANGTDNATASVATNGAANGTAKETANETKKGRGRPKSIGNGDKPAAAKREKKVASFGRSERKTRSQGAA